MQLNPMLPIMPAKLEILILNSLVDTEKDSRIGFWQRRAFLQNSHSHSRLALGQWSLAPYANFEEPSCQISDS